MPRKKKNQMSSHVLSRRNIGFGYADDWEREEAYDAIARLLKVYPPMPDTEIARRVGVSEQTVLRHRRRQDPPIPSYRERERGR